MGTTALPPRRAVVTACCVLLPALLAIGGCIPLIPPDEFLAVASDLALAPELTCDKLKYAFGVPELTTVPDPTGIDLAFEETRVTTAAGPARRGRGGRRWAFLTMDRERELLTTLQAEAGRGQGLTAKQIHGRVQQAVGKKVALDYVYRLLHRHGWRKLGPRPRHVKADPQAQAEFKKNSRNSSRKR